MNKCKKCGKGARYSDLCHKCGGRKPQKAEEPRFEDDIICRAFTRKHPEGASFEEIGRVFGASKQAIEQCHDRALRRLRNKGSIETLRQYLETSLNDSLRPSASKRDTAGPHRIAS